MFPPLFCETVAYSSRLGCSFLCLTLSLGKRCHLNSARF